MCITSFFPVQAMGGGPGDFGRHIWESWSVLATTPILLSGKLWDLGTSSETLGERQISLTTSIMV